MEKCNRKSLRRALQANVICHSDFAGQITYPVQSAVNHRRFSIHCTGYPKRENREKIRENGEIQRISLNGVATFPHSIIWLQLGYLQIVHFLRVFAWAKNFTKNTIKIAKMLFFFALRGAYPRKSYYIMYK